MRKPRVVTHAGITVNLAQVKCFKLSPFASSQPTNQLVIELQSRTEYVFHPGTNQWEKNCFTESIVCNFPDYSTAQAYLSEWEELWQEYLDD